MEGRGVLDPRQLVAANEGSARNPSRDGGANTVIYVVATHKEFQRQGGKPNPDACKHGDGAHG